MSKEYHFVDINYSDYELNAFYNKKVDEFVSQYRTDVQKILHKLLPYYSFFNYENFQSLFDEYVNKIKKFVSSLVSPYLITMIVSDDYPHHSDIFFGMFKNKGIRIKRRFDCAELQLAKSIILIDDFSGSGNTLIEYIKDKESDFNNIDLFFFPLFISELAISNIEKIMPSRIKIDMRISNSVDDGFLTRKGLLSEIDYDILSFYSRQNLKIKEDKLRGYKDSQCMVTLPYMTPNNTIGLFWCNQPFPFFPLFSRSNVQDKTLKSKRLSYDFIRLYNECIKDFASTKMKSYLLIAVLLYFDFDKKFIEGIYLQSKKGDFNDGIKFLEKKSIISGFKVNKHEVERYFPLDFMEASLIFAVDSIYREKVRSNLINRIPKH